MADFLGLRYRLLWAQARLRSGKMALFAAGYLVLCPVILLVAFGGMGAALASARTGKAEALAGILLSICFLTAAASALILGIGMNSVFSDSALRRYPISAKERFAARHISGCLEPLWLLAFALYCGFAIGFWLLGNAYFGIALAAALLLMISNYLFARVLITLVDRTLVTRIGPFLVVVAIMMFALFPAFITASFSRYAGRLTGGPSFLCFTPPFAGVACLTETALFPAFGWLLCLLGWCICLAAVLSQLDGMPMSSRTSENSHVSWDSFYDRVAVWFGGEMAPLVGKVMRYYIRSSQMRYSYPIVAISPLLALADGRRSFFVAMGLISIVGAMCMGAMTENIFGFDGAGFRRYHLLPIPPARVFRATAIVPLILGGATVPFSLALWYVSAHPRIPIGMPMIAMLVSCGFAGLFLFQGLGIWTSLFAPRAIEFKAVLGNKLSFAANALTMICLLVAICLPMVLEHLGIKTVLEHWWVALLILFLTAVFYIGTLLAGAVVFSRRREIILSTIEKGC